MKDKSGLAIEREETNFNGHEDYEREQRRREAEEWEYDLEHEGEVLYDKD